MYEWKLPDDRQPALRLAEAVIAGRVHAVTFTTGPAIRNWMAIAAEHDLDEPLRAALTGGDVVVGCVGPVCAEVAASRGLASEHLVVPAAWRLGPLVRAVADRLLERRVEIDVGGTEVVLSGTVVSLGGESVELSDTEARLLATLAARPNVVFAKADLLVDGLGRPQRRPARRRGGGGPSPPAPRRSGISRGLRAPPRLHVAGLTDGRQLRRRARRTRTGIGAGDGPRAVSATTAAMRAASAVTTSTSASVRVFAPGAKVFPPPRFVLDWRPCRSPVSHR